MKLISAPNRPACRVILCTCLLTTHQQGDYDKCGMWLCILREQQLYQVTRGRRPISVRPLPPGI